LRWSEINFKRNIIVLPGSRTKNSRAQVVPMTPMVRAILEARPRRDGRDFVFGVGERGFSGWSKSKARLDEASKIAPFVIHDIRRSAATSMSEIGVPPFHIEAVLNHVSGTSSVAKIYNRFTQLGAIWPMGSMGPVYPGTACPLWIFIDFYSLPR
jgi:integrase